MPFCLVSFLKRKCFPCALGDRVIKNPIHQPSTSPSWPKWQMLLNFAVINACLPQLSSFKLSVVKFHLRMAAFARVEKTTFYLLLIWRVTNPFHCFYCVTQGLFLSVKYTCSAPAWLKERAWCGAYVRVYNLG